MIPIILGQTFYQISAVIDDMMFSNMMIGTDITKSITTDMGNFNSSYSLLIGIPQGVASAMSASMLPSIVASYTQGEIGAVRKKIKETLKTNMFIAIPSFVGLFVLGKPIIQLLFARYDSTQGGMMLKIGAIAVVFYTLSTVTSSALQGIDEMSTPVKHSCISLVVHIILVFVLLKFSRLGIYAIVIGNASFPIIIFILNIISLYRHIGYRMYFCFLVNVYTSARYSICENVFRLSSVLRFCSSFRPAFMSYQHRNIKNVVSFYFSIITKYRKSKS